MPSSSNVLWVLAACCSLGAARVQAQAEQGIVLSVQARAEGSARCFEAQALQRRVAHYAGDKRAGAAALRFVLDVDGANSAELRVYRGDALLSRRRFVSLPDACADRRDAVAVSIALALEAALRELAGAHGPPGASGLARGEADAVGELGVAVEARAGDVRGAVAPAGDTSGEERGRSRGREEARGEPAAVGRGRAGRERAERERAERERAERERAERERAERERAAREQVERERADRERADRERADRERTEPERAARERVERERADRERADRERMESERAARERVERERAERERAERERVERERAERESVERTRLEREAAERAQAERELAERESVERTRLEREAAERAQAERESIERRRVERELAERERAERVQTERAQAERAQAEREALPSLTAAQVSAEAPAGGRVDDAHDVTADSRGMPNASSSGSRLRVDLHLGGRWLAEALPAPVWTGVLGAELRLNDRVALDFSAFASTLGNSKFVDGHALGWLSGGELLGCAAWRLGGVAAQGCLGAIAAACRAHGRGYEVPYPPATLWWAASTARLALRWPDDDRLSLRLLVQGHVSMLRPEFVLASDLHESLSASIVGGLLGLDMIVALE